MHIFNWKQDYLEQFESEWIKGHQDDKMEWESFEELKELPLSKTATMNVWCDKLADSAYQTYFSHKKWAIFTTSPTTQIITGNLDYNILQILKGQNIENYIHKCTAQQNSKI